MKKTLVITLGSMVAGSAMAGNLSLNANAHAMLTDLNTQATITSDTEWNGGSWSGTSINQSVNVGAFVNSADDNASSSNTAAGDIVSETAGVLSIIDTFNAATHADGAELDTYPSNSLHGATVSYSFTVGTASIMNLTMGTSSSSTGDFTEFGLWNAQLYVDNIEYPTAGPSSPPALSGNWLIDLTPGTHEIDLFSQSNIFSGPTNSMESMTEEVYFQTQAVPEPTPFVFFGLGLGGLLLRRRRH